jgi:hypothetical protein
LVNPATATASNARKAAATRAVRLQGRPISEPPLTG